METLKENIFFYFPFNFRMPNNGLGKHMNVWLGADLVCDSKLKKSWCNVKTSSRAAINADKKVYYCTRVNQRNVWFKYQ